jgi:hypothetical protein
MDDLKSKGMKVSECMLGNSVGTVVGVAVGTILGVRRKNLRPFVYAITMGTSADLFYGYAGNCRELIEDYEACKRTMDAEPKKK